MRQVWIEILVVCGLLALTMAQLQPGGQVPAGGGQTTACMSNFDENLGPRCFDSRGVSFQGILFLISQGQNGEMPSNTTGEALRELTCRHATMDFIIPCVLQLMNYFTNQTACPEQERAMIDGSAKRLLAIMDQLCIQPCEIETSQRAMQCFASAQIDPNRAMNSSMVDDKFTILGNTTDEIRQFCNNHGTLFTCLDAEKAQCPAFEKRMYEMGIDFTTMKQATAVLCQKQQEYMAALQCFTRSMPSTQQCMMETGRGMREIMIGRFQTGAVVPSTMTDRFCALRMQKVPCELGIFQQTCEAKMNTLRNEFECNILATPCRNNPNLRPIVGNMCQSSTPPEQHITARPPVVNNNNINDFTKTNTNVNVNMGNSQMNGQADNGAGDTVASVLAICSLVFTAVVLN